MQKIPKIIHYVWVGGNSKPPLVLKCIESWKRVLPDYEIKEWNENNFDINSHPYVKEAYENKKYAFVSDYIRLYVLKEFGGIYLDSDVEVFKSFDKFLNHSAFTGFESPNYPITAVMGAIKNHPWVLDLLSLYDGKKFIKDDKKIDYTTNTILITNLMVDKYHVKKNNSCQIIANDLHIYPDFVFCASIYNYGKKIPQGCYSRHLFNFSWESPIKKIRRYLLFPFKFFYYLFKDREKLLNTIQQKINYLKIKL